MASLPAAREDFEKHILDWARAAVSDGLALLRRERAFNECENAKKFVTGEQYPLRSRTISRLVDNRLRKIAFEIAGALTDVRPIWNYETFDQQFKPQGDILNKLARGWWKNGFVDRKLQSVLLWSLVGGSGYAYLKWNPYLPAGGDLELIPLDPRDVLPIEPVITDSIQDWRGMILRQTIPIETLKQMYPTKAHTFGVTRGSWFTPMTKEGGSIYNVVSSAWSILTRGSEGRQKDLPNATDLFHIYIKDESINTGDVPKVMGQPGSNWEYTVYPVGSRHPLDGHEITEGEARLYPRGRLIVCTQDAVCDDGPNPYWHGSFPVVRFCLESLPWSLLGASIIGDLIPLQNALNEGLRGIEDGMSQWLRRGVVADQHAISRNTIEALDTRKAGFKAYLNTNVGGDGFKIIDGPIYPPWYMQMIEFFKNELDDNSGVRGLQQMAQLKQMPSADTLEKFMDAMSPLLRVRARSMEVSLGELAEMLKVGFFQYYDTKRRMEILGVDGVTLEDFDFDPGTLVPAVIPGADRTERAIKHHKNFKFSVAPNSFLSISHTEHRMLMLQLFRENIMDPYTVWTEMDIPNIGAIPAETVPDRIMEARKMGLMQGPTSEVAGAQNQAQLLQLQLQIQMLSGQLMAMMGGMMPPPEGGAPGSPPPEGLPGRVGRPPSGQQPPQFVTRPDGRTIVSESGR